MADRLPDEVILAILEELDASRTRGQGPLPLDVSVERRALVMVCLASRRLCKIAQPVLWRRVIIGDGVQLERLRSGVAAPLGQHTRCYASVPDAHDDTFGCGTLLDVADVLPNIIELRIVGRNGPVVDPELLLPHAHLRLLALDYVGLPQKALAGLPCLEQLSLRSTRTTPEVLRAWICPERMPALRVLQIEDIMISGIESALLEEVLAPVMLARLDVVRTCWDDLHEHPLLAPSVGLAKSIAPPVLVDQHWSAPFGLSRHTLFSPPHADSAHGMAKRLVGIARGTSIDVAVSPSVLVVPKSLLERTAHLPAFVAGLQGLEAQLATKGARIIWYDDDYPHDLVPPEFLRYARELKAARRLEGEGQA